MFLVEDEFIVREGIKNNIDWAGEGFQFCGEAADGELALPLIQSEQPDIIISDLEMSGMDGRALCKHARRESALSDIPFVILSAFVDPEGSGNLADLPADGCLSKQIPVSDLVQLIRELLNASHRRNNSQTGSDRT